MFVCACACIYILDFLFFLLQGVTLDSSGRFAGEAERKLEEVIYLFDAFDD